MTRSAGEQRIITAAPPRHEPGRERREGAWGEKNAKYPGQSLSEFRSPSLASCSAPFNAPWPPVTPLLLVIMARRCSGLPRSEPPTAWTPADRATSCCRGLLSGEGPRLGSLFFPPPSTMNTHRESYSGSSSRSSLIASFRSAAAGDENRAPWVLAPAEALQVKNQADMEPASYRPGTPETQTPRKTRCGLVFNEHAFHLITQICFNGIKKAALWSHTQV